MRLMSDWRRKKRGGLGMKLITIYSAIKELILLILYGGSKPNKLFFPSNQSNLIN